MRISIDVDLEPSEFPLANELLQTLRLLTEHVKVKRRSSHSGQAPAPAAPAQHAVGPGQPPAAPVAAPVPSAVPVPAPVAAPVAAPVQAAAPPLPSTPQEARHIFTQLLSRLGTPDGPRQREAIAAEAARVLGSSGSVPTSVLVEEFTEALAAVAFDRANIERQQNAEPYLAVLPCLPEAQKTAVKQRLIPWVLGFLNQKRPVDVEREAVFLQADAFAVLVQMDFVAADGTVQTMGKLLKAPERRVAAVMTLCALVQRCKDKIKGANAGFLDATLALLAQHGMAEHRPAVEYVFTQLGRPVPQVPAPQPVPAPMPVPAPTPAAAPQQPPQQQQPAPAAAPVAAPVGADAGPLPPAPRSVNAKHRLTFTSPQNPGSQFHSIFSAAYDPYNQLMMSGGIDVPVALWSPDGRLQHQLPMQSGFFVSNIHVEPQNRLLIVCGAANIPDPSIKGRIALFDTRRGYANVGNVMRDDITSLAGVDTIPHSTNMLVAELLSGPAGGGPNQIAMYDYNRVLQAGNPDIQPTTRFLGHSDVVTAVAAGEREFKDCFLSASKDKTVMVWDTRAPATPVATLGVRAGDARTTHTDMVTCVDVCGYTVMSASLDGTVALWDLRSSDEHQTIQAINAAGNKTHCLRNGNVEQWATNGVVKAAMRGAPYDKLVAAATVRGLYLLDMSVAGAPVAKMLEVPNTEPQTNFCEVKWCANTGQLLAATGQTATVDLLEITV